MPILVIFSGLPATGKTSIARELARQLSAVYLRIDSNRAIDPGLGNFRHVGGGCGLPRRLFNCRGQFAGSTRRCRRLCHGWPVTRNAWLAVAKRTETMAVEVEIVCSDAVEHRRRVETRASDIPGLKLPTWQDVQARDYLPWHRNRIIIDTARQSLEQGVQCLRDVLRKG